MDRPASLRPIRITTPIASQIMPPTFAWTSAFTSTKPMITKPITGDNACAPNVRVRRLIRKKTITDTCSIRNEKSAPKLTSDDRRPT